MRIAFGRMHFGSREQFLKVLAQEEGKITPEAVRKKQEAFLLMLEKQVAAASDVVDKPFSYLSHPNFGLIYLGILNLYATALASLTQPPKGDPLENLERLEKLMNHELIKSETQS